MTSWTKAESRIQALLIRTGDARFLFVARAMTCPSRSGYPNSCDASVLLLLHAAYGVRCIVRLDCKGPHIMRSIGLPTIRGSHMHMLKEEYQKQNRRDDIWVYPIEECDFEEAVRLFVKRINIIVNDNESE